MRLFFSPRQLAHAPPAEFSRGAMIPYRESPDRAQAVLEALAAAGFDAPDQPPDSDPDPALLAAVHDPDYLRFLETAWDRWRQDHPADIPALPTAWPLPALGRRRPAGDDADIEALLGWYCFDSATPITADTWTAVRAAAASAQAAARVVAQGPGAPVAYALCRPPGHHAAAALMGGYCYLNNAALAAQTLRKAGAARVAVLDVDYHHGNGTQALFWERPDVVVASLHADPAFAFPYYSGGAEERGAGAGVGATLNLPLPKGTDDAAWLAALDQAIAWIRAAGVEALVVSLGVDTWEGDPLSAFTVTRAAYPRLGSAIAGLGLPTVVIQEGGYATAEMGGNVARVLRALAEERG